MVEERELTEAEVELRQLYEAECKAIARVCHQANKAYCEQLGDLSQLDWELAADWQRLSAIKGVMYRVENPGATPADMHENWFREKEADGWTYAKEKDVLAKTHPCMLPYNELPQEQQVKDALFSGVVQALWGHARQMYRTISAGRDTAHALLEA